MWMLQSLRLLCWADHWPNLPFQFRSGLLIRWLKVTGCSWQVSLHLFYNSNREVVLPLTVRGINTVAKGQKFISWKNWRTELLLQLKLKFNKHLLNHGRVLFWLPGEKKQLLKQLSALTSPVHPSWHLINKVCHGHWRFSLLKRRLGEGSLPLSEAKLIFSQRYFINNGKWKHLWECVDIFFK